MFTLHELHLLLLKKTLVRLDPKGLFPKEATLFGSKYDCKGMQLFISLFNFQMLKLCSIMQCSLWQEISFTGPLGKQGMWMGKNWRSLIQKSKQWTPPKWSPLNGDEHCQMGILVHTIFISLVRPNYSALCRNKISGFMKNIVIRFFFLHCSKQTCPEKLAVLGARLDKALSDVACWRVSLPMEEGIGTTWCLRSLPTP